MTQARSTLIPPGHAVYAHVVTRCVRRAWLFGKDRFSNRRFDHRCALVEGRVRLLAGIFGVGVYAFALMANHVHLVLAVLPDSIRQLPDEDIVERWLRLYPSRTEKRIEQRRAEILENPERIMELRNRLGSLSWFMKCLNEPIARMANQEDNAKGHFWEARFHSQVLLNERALLAAMAYVDLNPIRAKIATNLIGSRNTSIRLRCKAVLGNPELGAQPLRPICGVAATAMPPITVAEYIDLVDDTGRKIRADKRGAIPAEEPRALEKLGLSADHWAHKVKGVGSGYWRVVGTVDDIQEKAAAMGQAFLRGVGFARALRFL
jgi:REP element-mobilizing transposase RayT